MEGVDSSSLEVVEVENSRKTKPLLRSSLRSCLPGKSVRRFATSPILLGNFLPQLQFRGFPASLVFTTNPLFPPLQLIARFVSLFSHFRVNSFTLLSRNNNTNSAISGENLGHKSTRNLGANQWCPSRGLRSTD